MAKVSVVVRGNLGRDAEMKVSKLGKTYYSLSVGSTPTRKNAEGGYDDGQTMWFNVLVFEELNPFEFVKGTPVEVEGTFTHTTFTKRDGSMGFGLDVLADSIKRVEREKREVPEFAKTTSKLDVPASWSEINEDLPF